MLLCLLVGACDRTPAPSLPSATAPVALVDANVDAGGGDNYRYEIRYPALPPQDAPLAAALRAWGERQKHEFLADVGDRAVPEGANEAWQMHLDFALRAPGADFVCVLATGDAYSGGAHGNPLLASFVLHRPSRRVLALPELFVKPDAGLRVLATEARHALRERHRGNGRRIDDGTAPTAENYAVFLVDADAGGKARGLSLLFPAYQVAPYAEGPQQVDVPAARFRDLLKPEFKAAFVATPAK